MNNKKKKEKRKRKSEGREEEEEEEDEEEERAAKEKIDGFWGRLYMAVVDSETERIRLPSRLIGVGRWLGSGLVR